VSIALYHLAGKAITKLVADEFVSAFLAELVFAILVFASVLLLKQKDLFHSDPALFKSGWKSAGLLIFIIVAFGVMGLVELLNVKITPVQWALFIAQVILVGFAEEVLFRGLIQRAFHELFGEDSVANIYKTVISAGLIFGLVHLVNMDRGNPMLASVLQAGVNCFAGMYYCAIFFRTGKNIKYLIFLHAIYDYVGMVYNGRLKGASINNVLNPGGETPTLRAAVVVIMVWGGIYLLATAIALRPSKVKPLLTNTEEQNQS
jgi:membrane protease YdiL (CAAX protease family)